MEYWLIYDVETGDVLVRGSGMPGTAALQVVPEGSALVQVPWATVAQSVLDLDALRAAMVQRIDADAEAMRLRFLTPGAGQAMTYTRKEAEARAWWADNTTEVPFLSAEAAARDMALGEVVAEVLTLADAWVEIGSAIEGLRMGAKAALSRADTLPGIVAASTIDWTGLAPQTA